MVTATLNLLNPEWCNVRAALVARTWLAGVGSGAVIVKETQ